MKTIILVILALEAQLVWHKLHLLKTVRRKWVAILSSLCCGDDKSRPEKAGGGASGTCRH